IRCDHGADTPHAIGLLFEIAGKRIYMMGDTAYRPDWLDDESIKGVDLLILPINGAFGNLNSSEAAHVVKALAPKLAVPCHYWNFAQHFGSPYDFMTEMEALCPEIPYLLMRQGELKVLA
ncbi:MAG: MBL fold metallo-hydrolase, partial [Clostridia bacterium]|nr:MBL fold metallo-hydrolase [Clostridia bacterium]